MAKKGFNNSRSLNTLNKRKLFIIAAEGINTEPQYFDLFSSNDYIVDVKCLKGKNSAPHEVLKRMTGYLRKSRFRKTDEAWLVVDKDEWTNDQIDVLYMWSQLSTNYGFALSNPKFEYWLLLHFEDGHRSPNSNECTRRLNSYLPEYNKNIKRGTFTREQFQAAIQRAKIHDNPPCPDWHRNTVGTTVYRLVEKILQTTP